MKIIKDHTSIDFISPARRKLAAIISVILIAVSIVSISTRGLAFGIDFTGGVLLEVGYTHDADLNRIRQILGDIGYPEAQVQNFGTATDVMMRLPPQPEGTNSSQIRDKIRDALAADDPGVELRRVEFVGPQVGDELTEQGSLAMIFAYVMFRFQWRFAAGAVVALAHDVIITVGFFSVFGLPVDLTVLAAVLAVVGYSLNDTVVTFDRIRENFIKLRGESPENGINISINEMLGRTIITGLTTLLVLIALFVLGGESVGPFSLALIVGIIIGTYSSIYIASATALALGVSAQDLLPPVQDPNEVDELP